MVVVAFWSCFVCFGILPAKQLVLFVLGIFSYCLCLGVRVYLDAVYMV